MGGEMRDGTGGGRWEGRGRGGGEWREESHPFTSPLIHISGYAPVYLLVMVLVVSLLRPIGTNV